MKLRQGYTLIELVVVSGILAIIGVVSVSLFLSTLSGGGKSAGTNEVRANGDFAITLMERMIRNAIRIENSCTSDMSTLTILNPDGNQTTFSTVGNRIASNSGFLTGELVQVDGAVDFDCVQPTNGAPGRVMITFVLHRVNELSNRYEDVEAEFSTEVLLRSY